MRILMISDVYFPRINGVSTSIQTFKSEFEKLGHQVYLIAPDYPDSANYLANYPADHSIIRVPSRRVVFDPEDRMMHFGKILKERKRLKDLHFDLIHVHTPFVAHYAGLRLGKALGIPVVITYHTLFEEYLYHYIPFLPKALLKSFARRFSRRQCNDADAIIAPSSIIVELLRGYGVRRAIEVVPTGIQSDRFRAGNGERFRRKHDIAQSRKVLLNVSRIAFEKNIGLLIEVVALLRKDLPEVCLVIAGEGPAKKACMDRAERLGLGDNVRFVGYLDRNSALIDCYKSADLFVFASRTGTQGLVLLEAMAAGTPVVSVAAMGTRDILLDCPGARIVEDDAASFAATLRDLLTTEGACQALSNASVTSAAAWDSRVLAEKMLAHYQRVLEDNAPPAGLLAAARQS